MNPRKIVGVVFTVVYLTTTLNQTSCIKLVTRGYQILDPQTGHVIPPPVDLEEEAQPVTANFKRETNRNTFKEQRHRQQKRHQRGEDYISRDLQHNFPSIFDQFEHPFLAPSPSDSSLFSSSPTFKRHTQSHQSFQEPVGFSNNRFEEPSRDRPTRNHHGSGIDEFNTEQRHPGVRDPIRFINNNDLSFNRPPRNKRKKLFKKHVRPERRPQEIDSFSSTPFGSGIRQKRPHRRPSVTHHQPHKQRKKYPYYGRKRRSPEPMPWVLLDPMTGRNIRYPKQLFTSSTKPVKRQNEYLNYYEEAKKEKRRTKARVLPKCYGTYFNEECNYLLNNALPQKAKQDRNGAIPEQQLPLSNSINIIRQTRNLAPLEAAESNNNYQYYPTFNRYDKYRYLIGREKGSEYLSRYSGLPIYKYSKKYPLGYGRKKRSAEPMPWTLLDPNTGRPVETGNQRAKTNQNYESRRRPNRNHFGTFFKRGNRYNGRNHLFYDKEEVFNNEIRHERRTKKNNNHIKQTFNSGREYYDNQSGRPVYKYFKKFPNYGYGRKRRSANPQQWELIDPLTGRNVEPKKAPQRQGEIKKNNVATPKNIPDSLFDQFFQRHTRNERFQPGPELAPESESVANHHQAITQHPFKGVEIHTGDNDRDHLTSNGRPVYKHHKRYPYLG